MRSCSKQSLYQSEITWQTTHIYYSSYLFYGFMEYNIANNGSLKSKLKFGTNILFTIELATSEYLNRNGDAMVLLILLVHMFCIFGYI